MTEQEYREETTLTVEQVKFQLKKHNVIDFSEFFNEVGHKKYYTGDQVLDWLGY